jgi:AcrR family transcriptional regulator
LVEELLETLHAHDLVIDWPMEHVDNETRGIRATVPGTDRAIRRAAADLPGAVRLRLERMGKYEPVTGATDLPVELTERQREMLDTTVHLGYYETPRRTTHREIAAELDLSVGTVTEHFQRVEASDRRLRPLIRRLPRTEDTGTGTEPDGARRPRQRGAGWWRDPGRGARS